MKKDKIIYWTTTVLVVILGVGPALFYFTDPMIDGFRRLGFPDYFRIQLALSKFVGAPLILIPAVPPRIKEWVYVAFGITFFSGAIGHTVVDGISTAVMAIVTLALLIVSYRYFRKMFYA